MGNRVWEVTIRCREGVTHSEPLRLADELAALKPFLRDHFQSAPPQFSVDRGYLIEADLAPEVMDQIAHRLLADPVAEEVDCRWAKIVADNATLSMRGSTVAWVPESIVTVLRKPGVMDPVALSARQAIASMGHAVAGVRTFVRYSFRIDIKRPVLDFLARKVLANPAVDQVVMGALRESHLRHAEPYTFVKITIPLRGLDDIGLRRLSQEGQLYLNLPEMRAIQKHFDELQRNPTDIELETIAQTWSEHCSHKTLRGPYEFNGQRSLKGLLKDTIMEATRALAKPWCVSTFVDNAGIIRFDDLWNVCFKVETHNHPSAIEPYGGANTGIGGVIRDILGAGLGAKPICNTDVFCVAPPDTAHENLPEGVIHPARVLRGVVAGVRDYGNRMGIPTVNGAVCFDPRYLGNPLVYCGTVGLIPADKSFGKALPGDLIVALGGRTGRDGIHGATFSSGELTTQSETVSGGAVQIGNAITQKKLQDVLLQARDQNLFHAVTDCGAGGFSSAVGEMGEEIGAKVRLEAAPLKYAGLSYTEIWISEAQERMVLAVAPDQWPTLASLAKSEDVEAVVLGHFEPTGRLTLTFNDQVVGDLSMHFLHRGRPAVLRRGEYQATPAAAHVLPTASSQNSAALDWGKVLLSLLAAPNVCSKEWIIRQYDHEVQGGSVVKPLVGAHEDGPSDAAVLTPVLGCSRGLAVACGINPYLGDLDPYHMAASAIDEALRNVVAVGGDPAHTALLDNFCWGNTARPEVFGTLCQAAFACRDVALAYGTPFISGKDSLNNEFDAGGQRIVIPPTLLISALSIVPDVRRCVTMDLKEAGNLLVLLGLTRAEMGGSHFNLVTGSSGGAVPIVDTTLGKRIFAALHAAIQAGTIRACHDLSEGGLAVAVAEMAFAGDLGATLRLTDVPRAEVPPHNTAPTSSAIIPDHVLLFAESNTRFLLEVAPAHLSALESHLGELPHAVIGSVTSEPQLVIHGQNNTLLLSRSIADLRQAWQQPLAW